MPRPKVRPEDRQRSLRACSACKSSKIRCNSELPCSACLKRGRASACVYSDIDRRRRRRPGGVQPGGAQAQAPQPQGEQQQQQQPQQQQHDPSAKARGDRPNSGPARASSNPGAAVIDSSHATSQVSPANTAGSEPDDAGHSPHVRMPSPSVTDEVTAPLPKHQLLISSAGEKVYVGETASLSFLYFLRKTLRPYVGRTRFTDGETHNIMHEWETGHVECNNVEASAQQMYLLLESYFEATSGLFDLFTADEIDALVSERAKTYSTSPNSLPSETFSPFTAKSKRDDLAALDVALAIGAQTAPQGSTIVDAQTQAALFSSARQVAFEGMIANPSLSMVRLFLLMAFYMLGACHRNAASMYLGVASKAAVVLGLSYIKKHRSAQLDDYDLRLRIWNSLVVLDILMSFILGRPQSMPPTRSDASRGSTPASENGQSTFLAIVRGCSLIENIVHTLRPSTMLHVPTAESLLEQLRLWTQSLPEAVRQFTFTTNTNTNSGSGFSLESADRQALVGNLHVSCVYYFAVILITRPFLIADHMLRLRARAAQNGRDAAGASAAPTPAPPSESKQRNVKVSKLAQVCVSSAMFMAETLQKLRRSQFAFGNLCLVKAWIFGSGLVLGFSMFAGEPRQDVSDAFAGACDVLAAIGQRSPQAKIYHDILTTMGEAVTQYRRRESREARNSVQQYMSQILVVDVLDQDNQHDANNSGTDGTARPTDKNANANAHPQRGQSSVAGSRGDDKTIDGRYTRSQHQNRVFGGMPGQMDQNNINSDNVGAQYLSPFSAQDLGSHASSDPSTAPAANSFSQPPSQMPPNYGSGGTMQWAHMTDWILDDLQIDWGDLDLQLGEESSGLFESAPFESLFYSVE